MKLTVVLDFFGVLVQEGMSISGTLYGMVRDRVAYEPLWSTYSRLAVGDGSDEEFWRLAAGGRDDWREVRQRFFDVLTPEPRLPETVAELKARGARLALLSEIPAGWVDPLLERLGIAGQFDCMVTSGRARATKPEPAIFDLLMSELGAAAPGEARYYVDDRLSNLAAGERYGLSGVWMRRGPSPLTEYRPRRVISSLHEILDVVDAGASGASSFEEARATILDELRRAADDVDAAAAMGMVEMLLAAPRVFVYGRGRTGLATWAFASRLAQMGLDVHVVGEMTAPAISCGDLLVVASGTGSTRTTLLAAEEASRIGARIVALTAHRDSPLAALADLIVGVAGATRARANNEKKSAQYGGSLFEQTLLLMLDAVAMVLKRRLATSDREMDRRHANLE
jgi:6-phospho-3-hexuloisomerase